MGTANNQTAATWSSFVRSCVLSAFLYAAWESFGFPNHLVMLQRCDKVSILTGARMIGIGIGMATGVMFGPCVESGTIRASDSQPCALP